MHGVAIAEVEQGARPLNARELVGVAQATDLDFAWFVTDQPALAVSRRGHDSEGSDPLPTDLQVGKLKREVEQLLELELLRPKVNGMHLELPSDYEGAAQAALAVRQRIGFPEGRIDVAAAAEQLGLYLYVLPLPKPASPGASVAVNDQLGVALVKESDPNPRQRFTVAHEIGHHVFQDAYGSEAFGREAERIINSFAADLLAPRDELQRRWPQLVSDQGSQRQAGIALAVEYQVSWSALCPHLRNIALINDEEWRQLEEDQPARPEYEALGYELLGYEPSVNRDFGTSRVPEPIRAAVLQGYRRNLLGQSRALALLHGAVVLSDLPDPEGITSGALLAELFDA